MLVGRLEAAHRELRDAQGRAHLDADIIRRLQEERDQQTWIIGGLRSELETVGQERDAAARASAEREEEARVAREELVGTTPSRFLLIHWALSSNCLVGFSQLLISRPSPNG